MIVATHWVGVSALTCGIGSQTPDYNAAVQFSVTQIYAREHNNSITRDLKVASILVMFEMLEYKEQCH